MSFEQALTLFIVLCVSIFLYFIPATVASHRRHRNRFAIFVANLMLGWTMLFWVGALIWACTSNVEDR